MGGRGTMRHLKNFKMFESRDIKSEIKIFLPYLKRHIAFPEMFDYDPTLYQMCFEFENLNMSDNDLAEGETNDKSEQKKILQYLSECDRDLLDRYYAYNQKISDDHSRLPNPWETELAMPFESYFGTWFINEYLGSNNDDDRKILSNPKLYSLRILKDQGFTPMEIDIFNWFKNGYQLSDKFSPKWWNINKIK